MYDTFLLSTSTSTHMENEKKKKKKTCKRKRPVFKVNAGNMFTKAHPNSLWQCTAEKIAACSAAKFRRVKRSFCTFSECDWCWASPEKVGGSVIAIFPPQKEGWFRFFFRIRFLVKLRKMHTLCGDLAISICSGKGRISQTTIYKYSPIHSGGHNIV